ncbi:MAG TPA: hypothetical protein VF478_11420 [Anaerolineae bacterium]
MRPPTRRFTRACLGLFGASSLIVAGFAWIFLLQFPSLGIALAPTLTESPTAAPTKFAIAVTTPTLTPSSTPTATATQQPSFTNAPTRTPTRTSTARPTLTASLTPPPTPTSVNVGEEYGTLTVYPSPSDHSAAQVERNLAARGYSLSDGTLGLVNLDGPADAGAPQLYSLFFDERVPVFNRLYRINAWDWSCNCPGTLPSEPQVALAGLAVTRGEIIRVPRSSYYLANDYQALVLYADRTRITINYTHTDNPVRGYTLYIQDLAVDDKLLALYQQSDGSGRVRLPALRAGQGIGRASGNEIKIAIRDAGGFMDPRSRKDWWRGK